MDKFVRSFPAEEHKAVGMESTQLLREVRTVLEKALATLDVGRGDYHERWQSRHSEGCHNTTPMELLPANH